MKNLYLFIGCVSIVSLLFLWITKPYNLIVTPDSISYIEVATNFAEGKGIVDNQGELVNHWPPLYPILLGLSSYISGLDVLNVGIYFNLILIILYSVLFVFVLKVLNIKNNLKVIFF